jgi:hypothetical protein
MIVALLLAAATPAAADGASAITIPVLFARRAELDGKRIEVRGWMGKCQARSCLIYVDAKSARMDAVQPGHSHWLSIGSAGRVFDDKATSLRGKQVMVRGRLDATCLSFVAHSLPHSGDVSILVCADRVPEIQPDGPQSLIPVKDH